MTVSESLLLLLPPGVVANPTKAEHLLSKYSDSASEFHHQVLDRVTTQAVTLPSNHYQRIHLVNPVDDVDSTADKITLDNDSLEVIFKALAPGGTFTGGVHDSSVNLTAMLVGFVPNGTTLSKPQAQQSVGVSLKRKNGTGSANSTSTLPQFKKLSDTVQLSLDDDDDIIDENNLVQDENIGPAILIPKKCDPGPGKRRKKACKDCTCGLKELEEQGVDAARANQQTVVSLNPDETAEVDFTVPGKTTGSCGSCALGDAFRCDGCPYLGLPPFKPGEVVRIDALGGDDL